VNVFNKYLRAGVMSGTLPHEMLDLADQMREFKITPNTASINLVARAWPKLVRFSFLGICHGMRVWTILKFLGICFGFLVPLLYYWEVGSDVKLQSELVQSLVPGSKKNDDPVMDWAGYLFEVKTVPEW
jgi:hypothetical protein